MIKKVPLAFLNVKSKLVMTFFMFVLLRARIIDMEQFQRKEGNFVNFHAILK